MTDKGGRPSIYTDDLADLICEQIAQGKALATICNASDDLPAPRTVYRWLREKDGFRHNYACAKEDQADYLAEQVLEVADNSELEPNDKRIRVDARKWLASKFKPKAYSDRLDIGNAEDKAFNITVNKLVTEDK